MAQQIINTGIAANDGKGDSLLSAGIKINANFTELYLTKVPDFFGNANKVLSTNGTSLFWVPSTVSNAIQTTSVYNDPTWIATLAYSKLTGKPTIPTLVSQLSNDTGFITTNGLPSQSGNTGKYLTTNGTALSWVTPTSGTVTDVSVATANGFAGTVATSTSTPTITITTSVTGILKGNGTTISAATPGTDYIATLPTATSSVLGGVKVDGSSITISGSGVISASVTGAVVFKGTWNANTNTPTLVNGTGTSGWQYAVSVAGTRDLGNGSIAYGIGDFIIYDGTEWINISANNGVSTFNTRSGAVTLTSSDVTDALGYTPIQTSSLSITTDSASSGGTLTYSAGVFTFSPASIPTYTVSTLTANAGGALSLTGTTFSFTPAATYILPTATPSVLGGIKIDNNTIVINNGVISVGGALTSATIFKGSWDVSTNTPTLSNTLPANVAAGWQYIVSVGGTRDIGNGSITWSIGDLAIYDGAKWVRIPGGNTVASFNTRQGAITLTSSDVTTALGFTPIQSSSLSITSATASGSTSTLSYASGVFTFTSASASSILGGISVASSNGFSGSNSSGAITIRTSITGLLKGNGTAISAATAGTDYQAAISATGLLKSNGTSGNVSAAVAGTDYFAPASTTANYVLAAPNGSAGTPTFRALVAADIPSLTSAQLATILSDETGTGLNVMGTSPTITTSLVAGSASFALINTTATTVNFAGAATTALNIGASSAPITGFAATATTSSTSASLGYLGSPINTQASTYTLVIGDAGKTIYAAGNLTIPANASVAFPVGTIINVIASAGITIAITSDTLQWGGQATSQTGTRTVAIYGMASLQKVTNTIWYISGVGVT